MTRNESSPHDSSQQQKSAQNPHIPHSCNPHRTSTNKPGRMDRACSARESLFPHSLPRAIVLGVRVSHPQPTRTHCPMFRSLPLRQRLFLQLFHLGPRRLDELLHFRRPILLAHAIQRPPELRDHLPGVLVGG